MQGAAMTRTSEFMRNTMAIGAAAMLFGLGMTGSVHANVIAVSLDNVRDLQIGGSGLFTPGQTTSSDAASYNATSSGTTAQCNPGAGPCNPGGSNANAPQATAGPGPFPAEDTYTKPPTGGFVGSRGDANVINSDPNFGGGEAASNVAESRLNSSSTGGASGFNMTVATITDMSSASFNFLSDPYLQVFVAEAGDNATAILGVQLSLVDATGATVFLWTPGVTSGEIGVGSETDPFSLNQTLIATTPAGNSIFNPSPGIFSATTGTLDPTVNYTLNFQMTETVRTACGSPPGVPPTVTCSASAPEPTTLALLGIALAGLAASGRRKH
jgi:hypothetical protein